MGGSWKAFQTIFEKTVVTISCALVWWIAVLALVGVCAARVRGSSGVSQGIGAGGSLSETQLLHRTYM
jgi:hypothetical protein